DYVALVGPARNFTIPAGQTSTTVVVQVLTDTMVEPNETFTASITSAVSSSTSVAVSLPPAAAGGQATGTIVDDDGPTITVSAAIASSGEGSDNTFNNAVAFTITLSQAPVAGRPVTVFFTTQGVGLNPATGGTPATPGVDFLQPAGFAVFNPGFTTATIF